MKKDTKTAGRKRCRLIKAAGLLICAAAIAAVLSSCGENRRIHSQGFTFAPDELGNYMVESYDGRDEDIVIPDTVNGVSVTGICPGAFSYSDCKDMKTITIPSGIYEIPDDAFRDCENLTSVNLPDTLRRIGDCAFSNCGSLASITLPDGLTSIGISAFYDCDALEEIIVPGSTNSIGDGAFMDCDNLLTATVNSNGHWDDMLVHEVDLRWFYHCNRLTTLNIHCYTGSILTGTAADHGLPALKNINIVARDGEIMGPNAASVYGSVDGILYRDTQLTYCPRGKTGTVTVPDWVTAVDSRAFAQCRYLTAISLPAGLSGINTDCFDSCQALEAINVDGDNPIYSSVDGVLYTRDGSTLVYCPRAKKGKLVVPYGVKHIGADAFSGCKELNSITLPDSVTDIGSGAFDNTGLSGAAKNLIYISSHGRDPFGYTIDDYINGNYDDRVSGWQLYPESGDWLVGGADYTTIYVDSYEDGYIHGSPYEN